MHPKTAVHSEPPSGTEALALAPCSRRFRSAISGLWYENADAAGTIDGVEMYGQRITRNDTELRMDFIRRVGKWADELHSANK